MATANVCGWMAKLEEASDRRLRRSALLRKIQQHQVQLAAVQETHFNSPEEIASQRFWVQRRGYDLRATVADGFGSVAVLWSHSQRWEEVTTALSPRLLVVDLHSTGSGYA